MNGYTESRAGLWTEFVGPRDDPMLDTHRERELDLVESIEGWLARAEARELMRLAEAVPADRAIVEIGNYRGRSTVALALGSERGARAQVYTFDPHVEFVGPRGGRFGREDQAHLYANLARAGVGARVSVVGLASQVVAHAWPACDVGLMFIDGDHRYESVRADHAAWRPWCAPGAIVAFDDCDFADVKRLVGELERDGELSPRGEVGKVRWFEACL